MTRKRTSLTAAILLAPLLASCGDDGFEVTEASIADIQTAITDGRVTCREVVEAYLARIEAYDQPESLNAISMLNPKALEKADAIDARLKAGEQLGPLFCAPILVKDNFDTHDLPTTGGSIALANSYPPDDAFMVRKIREADAIVIAKTNMAEWAFSPRQTQSSSSGITANAYALDRVPAGSSGGTASGVAASFGVAGLGSDTGNSIRGPSAHLALFGIRSTIGLTSRDGVIPLAFDRDIAGPMTRTVEDGARVFNVVAGYDQADPFTEMGRGKGEADYTAFLDANGLKGARIGVLRHLADPKNMDAEVAKLFEQALKDLEAAGAVIVDPVDIANWETHQQGGYFCQRFRYDMWVYLQSLGDKAPIKDVMEVLETGQYSDYVKSGLERFSQKPMDVAPEDWEEPCLPYLDNPQRAAFLADAMQAMANAQVDVFVYPSWNYPPAHLAKADEEYKGDNSQRIAPATGMPAATIPMGYLPDGLPSGLQLLARPYDEATLFKLAYAYEQAYPHRKPPALFPPLEKE